MHRAPGATNTRGGHGPLPRDIVPFGVPDYQGDGVIQRDQEWWWAASGSYSAQAKVNKSCSKLVAVCGNFVPTVDLLSDQAQPVLMVSGLRGLHNAPLCKFWFLT